MGSKYKSDFVSSKSGTWVINKSLNFKAINEGAKANDKSVTGNQTGLAGNKGRPKSFDFGSKKIKSASVNPVHEGGKTKDSLLCAKDSKMKVNHFEIKIIGCILILG